MGSHLDELRVVAGLLVFLCGCTFFLRTQRHCSRGDSGPIDSGQPLVDSVRAQIYNVLLEDLRDRSESAAGVTQSGWDAREQPHHAGQVGLHVVHEQHFAATSLLFKQLLKQKKNGCGGGLHLKTQRHPLTHLFMVLQQLLVQNVKQLGLWFAVEIGIHSALFVIQNFLYFCLTTKISDICEVSSWNERGRN